VSKVLSIELRLRQGRNVRLVACALSFDFIAQGIRFGGISEESGRPSAFSLARIHRRSITRRSPFLFGTPRGEFLFL
jgi:hypothetical protein